MAFAWVVVLAFVRLSISPAIFTAPLSPAQAIGVVRAWLERQASTVIDRLPRHLEILDQLLADTGAVAHLVADAHLAALAIQHHARVVSFDADFGRFPGLEWERPRREA